MYTVLLDTEEVPGTGISIVEKLKDVTTASFVLDNTPHNRDLLSHDKLVTIKYFEITVFEGYLIDFKLKQDVIVCKARDKVVELERTYFSKDQGQEDLYLVSYRETAASTILSDILSGTGYTGSAPTTAVTIRFEHLSRLKCIRELAKVLGKDWWRSDATIYIGDKGTDKGLIEEVSVLDKEEDSKNLKNKIRVIGRDLEGRTLTVIVEDATSQTNYGVRELTVVERNAADTSTLTSLGSQLLSEKKDPILKLSLSLNIRELYDKNLTVGDTVTLEVPEVAVSGSFRIYSIKHSVPLSTLSIATAIYETSDYLKELSDYKVATERRKIYFGELDERATERITTAGKQYYAAGESEAGYYTETDGVNGTIAVEKDYIGCASAAGVGYAIIRHASRLLDLSHNLKMTTYLWAYIYPTDEAKAYVFIGDRSDNGLGFVVDFYGVETPVIDVRAWSVVNGTIVEDVRLELISDASAYEGKKLEIEFVPGTKAAFYIDGELKAELTNLPTGTVYPFYLEFNRSTYTGITGSAYLENWLVTERW